ncbi:hypothetical protein DZA28_29270 [Pseudomonas alloputida]|uniref:Uncharacterized protein n=5 Tax=Pseudomonas TaxID=286 RepID=A0AAP7KDJ3_9PSED|nr:hypothetical protein DZC31_30810 [Stenotrophomonas rhizophila]ESW38351.1 hypothetical protein O164_18070 [Pseudomonas taiwanensis SJ9]KIC80964.1 hypothetical protein RR51_18660 [Pseudomonas sp. C5pp]OAH43462.1 hypothetical protein AYJ70_28070 [Pseudomonas monteilii]TRZ57486.1 hypothetical protein DZA28_29270 [Pseudomonas alloputida]
MITGGKPSGQSLDTAERRKQLGRIRTCSRFFFEPPFLGPRMALAVAAAMAVGALSVAAVGTGWTSMLASCATFAAVLRFGKAAKTWGARMDAFLAEYDPLDKEAYRRLQAITEKEGLSPCLLDEWLSSEYAAIDSADGVQPASARRGRFLRKKI